MTKNGKSEFASPFDDMLAENRKEFEDLYGGPAPKPETAKQAAMPALARSSAPSRRAPPPRSATPAGAPVDGSVDGIAFRFRP